MKKIITAGLAVLAFAGAAEAHAKSPQSRAEQRVSEQIYHRLGWLNIDSWYNDVSCRLSGPVWRCSWRAEVYDSETDVCGRALVPYKQRIRLRVTKIYCP